jgi:hypothetical protein
VRDMRLSNRYPGEEKKREKKYSLNGLVKHDLIRAYLHRDAMWLPDYIVRGRVSMRLAAFPFRPFQIGAISKVIAHELVDRKLP